ncbi:MAG: SET domain-containing protein-lysine N-methyltransferase [Deltaproteobacteria bacterium]
MTIINGKMVIKDTGKYGNGVFAAIDIKKGEIITTLSGEIITFDECVKRINNGEENITDSLMVGLELDMDLDEISRTFNHSCDPNAGLLKISDLVALRDITHGEEITCDYSATEGPNIPDNIWSMKCNCGSDNCRKVIGNVLTIPPKQLRKYIKAGALQDYIFNELKVIKKNGGVLPKYNNHALLRLLKNNPAIGC